MANKTQTELKALTLQELELTEEFLALTPKQKMWVRTYLETKDFLFSTRAAYNSKSTLNAQILSHRVRRSPEVTAAIRLCIPDFNGARSERDVILEALQRKLLANLRDRKSVLTVAEKDMVNKLFAAKGWDLPNELRGELDIHGHAARFSRPAEESESKPESKPEAFKVGDIFEYDGTPTRITALDANGTPTDGEPLEGAELEAWLTANKSKAGV